MRTDGSGLTASRADSIGIVSTTSSLTGSGTRAAATSAWTVTVSASVPMTKAGRTISSITASITEWDAPLSGASSTNGSAAGAGALVTISTGGSTITGGSTFTGASTSTGCSTITGGSTFAGGSAGAAAANWRTSGSRTGGAATGATTGGAAGT